MATYVKNYLSTATDYQTDTSLDENEALHMFIFRCLVAIRCLESLTLILNKLVCLAYFGHTHLKTLNGLVNDLHYTWQMKSRQTACRIQINGKLPQ